jgi:hypothetical protein
VSICLIFSPDGSEKLFYSVFSFFILVATKGSSFVKNGNGRKKLVTDSWISSKNK